MNVLNERRVVVTGVAAISPFGLAVEDLWSGLTEGRSAVGPLSAFSVDGLPLRYAAEARSFTGHISEFGDLDGQGSCSIPQRLLIGETYSCTFDAVVNGGGVGVHINTVTVTGSQVLRIATPGGVVSVSDSDSAYVLTITLPGIDDIKAVPISIWAVLLSGLGIALIVLRNRRRTG